MIPILDKNPPINLMFQNCFIVRPLLFVNVFLVTSELTKACGRAVIISHYSIILPQHFLYKLNISCTYQRQDACTNVDNCTEHAHCEIMTIMANLGGLLNSMRAGDQKHVYN